MTRTIDHRVKRMAFGQMLWVTQRKRKTIDMVENVCLEAGHKRPLIKVYYSLGSC